MLSDRDEEEWRKIVPFQSYYIDTRAWSFMCSFKEDEELLEAFKNLIPYMTEKLDRFIVKKETGNIAEEFELKNDKLVLIKNEQDLI